VQLFKPYREKSKLKLLLQIKRLNFTRKSVFH